ncbi:hypothetical protein EVAR_72341_1 [Eumeta japonica]|uniref:Reverse transcriptase domain-containing protein n=1 Tax=Eumeta variegata TaxID=151549 RepID=A0A4C1T088_EUMVA|nr:hypothetical protein EVAR_72341_1 [Eumeta japonica]
MPGRDFSSHGEQDIRAYNSPANRCSSPLADNQYGFRKGRSTLDAISLVVNTAKEAIAGTRWKGGAKKYLVAALDIRNASTPPIGTASCKLSTRRTCRISAQTSGLCSRSTPVEYHVRWSSEIESPRCVKLVAYADDVAAVIVAKHLDEIQHLFDITFKQINQWMDSVNLQLAKQKTEAVLITSRKKLKQLR